MRETGWGDGVDMEEGEWGRWDRREGTAEVGRERWNGGSGKGEAGGFRYKVKQRVLKAY